MTVQTFNYKNINPVSFHKRMVNATQMAKAFGKLPKDYLKTKSAKAYLSFLNSQSDDIHFEDNSRRADMPIGLNSQKDDCPIGNKNIHNSLSSKVLRVVKGGKHQGTWMCEDLALDFAQWLSLEFRHWVNLRIKELLTNGNDKVPTSFAEALQLAADLEKEKEILKLQVAEDKPKVEFFDAVTGSKDAKPFADIAKVLGYKKVGRNKLFSILRKESILMRNNTPYQKYVDLEYFKLIETKFTKPDGTVCVYIKTLILQKGVDFIMKKLNKLGYEKIID
jgi:phage antirepressor YoqD-like protein